MKQKDKQRIVSAEDNLHDENNDIKIELSTDLDINIKNIEELFKDCADIVKREVKVDCDQPFRIYGVYTDGLINREILEHYLLTTLLNGKNLQGKILAIK